MSDERQYAQGGYIDPYDNGGVLPMGLIPVQVNRGCVVMSYSEYKDMGAAKVKGLFPNRDIEVVFTAEEVRGLGPGVLEKLQEELDNQNDAG